MSKPYDVTIERRGKNAEVTFVLHFWHDTHALTLPALQLLLSNITHALDQFSPEADTEDD